MHTKNNFLSVKHLLCSELATGNNNVNTNAIIIFVCAFFYNLNFESLTLSLWAVYITGVKIAMQIARAEIARCAEQITVVFSVKNNYNLLNSYLGANVRKGLLSF